MTTEVSRKKDLILQLSVTTDDYPEGISPQIISLINVMYKSLKGRITLLRDRLYHTLPLVT